MILEGLVTTCSSLGTVNLAPMGPIVNVEMTEFLFRPFKTSTTYQNLKAHPEGVFHVTDDVLLIARGAIGKIDVLPDVVEAVSISGVRLADCCQSFEFRIEHFNEEEDRTVLTARIIARKEHRPFFGFNRAKHAVLEAAILATRLHLLPREQVLAEYEKYQVIVEKTAGAREFEAFDLLKDYVGARD